ncbi:MAG: hypothetical protein OXE86_17100 [Alphaproteobacteria bacterium]|nr:hypothetical protein [Alphaproteobacteria bacterium]
MANRVVDERIVIADTVTKLGAECAGRVVLGGSHGGVYAAYCAVKARARGVILNDAGRAKDDSGIGGGVYCQELDIPYATVETMSCRIGDGESAFRDGIISHANPLAASLGVAPGMPARKGADLMCRAALSDRPVPAYAEARTELPCPPGTRMIVLMDSASLIVDEDVGRIVVTGSHGGVPSPDPAAALRVDAHAGFFHDAGVGRDRAALGRLAPLDDRGIIAATVACMSARIGDGASIYHDGVLSHVNRTAAAAGAAAGRPARDFIDTLAGN